MEIDAFIGQFVDDLAKSPLRRAAEGEFTSSPPFYYPKRHRQTMNDLLTVADVMYTIWREKRRACKHDFEPDSSPGWVICPKCGEDRAAVMTKKQGAKNGAKAKRTRRVTPVSSDERGGDHDTAELQRPAERGDTPVFVDGPE